MKNDMTWVHSDNSEQNKQTQKSSQGTHVDLRSKTPVPCSPLPVPYSLKNDMTWEHTDNSEQNKQMKESSLGNLVGSRSKTPVPCSPLPVPYSQRNNITWEHSDISEQNKQMKLPSKHTIKVLLARKAWITGQLEGGKRGKEIPVRLKHYLNAEYTALTRVIDFTGMMLEYIPDKQVLQEMLCRYENNEQLVMDDG